MWPFGSHRKRFAGPDHVAGTRERRLGTRLQLQSQARRPVPGGGGLSQDGPAYFEHCVYISTENNPMQAHPGIVVIDVSDPTNPRATAYLADTPAGLNPHENNQANEKRGLLWLAESNGPNFAVYDL